MNDEMTFEEALAHSLNLELNALEGIALNLPDKAERVKRHIDFNPYIYMPRLNSARKSQSL